MTYFVFVWLTTAVLPLALTVADTVGQPAAAVAPIALHWFVFFGVGVRLGVAGARQLLQPAFTAREIFHLEGSGVLAVVRELGIANLGAGVVALLSTWRPSFALPIAIWAALFYGAAAAGHLHRQERNAKELTALATDLVMALALGLSIAGTWLVPDG